MSSGRADVFPVWVGPLDARSRSPRRLREWVMGRGVFAGGPKFFESESYMMLRESQDNI